MKKIFRVFLFALVLSAGTATINEAKSQVSASVSFSVFYNSLRPYGRWVNHGSYGQVWISNTRDFRPYSTGGHWAYTDYGWTWVSDYDWGWAPFHYGRWAYESSLGWYWVPGYEWAPAWVAWRGGGDYYGWAPLSPGLNISVGVSFDNQIPYDRWVFAPHRYITSPYISRYYVPRTRNVTIIKNTTIVNNVNVRNNVHYVGGPRREDVERVNHTRIQTLSIANSSRPGKTVVNNKTVNIYRPVINNDKTVVNNNNTTVNKNSNNTTTVNKNSNNTTVNKNSNNTTTKNNTTVNKNSNNKSTEKNTEANNTTVNSNNKETHNTKKETVNKHPNRKPATDKKPAENKKPDNPPTSQLNNNGQANQHRDVSAVKHAHNKQVARKKAREEMVAKRNTTDSAKPNERKK